MRIKLIDRDGSLVCNRKIGDQWIDLYHNDHSFRNTSIVVECREHGVELIGNSFIDGDIVVLVKYPKER